MRVDIWHKDEKAARVDCFFYSNSGEYRGNLYNESGKAIGDFSARDSVEVERRFPGIFGD